MFKGFDLIEVANMTDEELENILLDPGIIRNRLKVYGFRKNAKAFLGVVEEVMINNFSSAHEVPTKTVQHLLQHCIKHILSDIFVPDIHALYGA